MDPQRTPNYVGPGRYRHYKGAFYEVLGLALQEDTVTKIDKGGAITQVGLGDEITFVIYRPLTPGSMLEDRAEDFWARGLDDFNEMVALPPPFSGGVRRFERLRDDLDRLDDEDEDASLRKAEAEGRCGEARKSEPLDETRALGRATEVWKRRDTT